ncbi:amidase [Raineyella sp. LH-20]|uniref:amidase n=1 Tax=Raineyella sp. LH-20 TaxID=3081204 RepID=UPI002953ADF3|nr:amidase [Raineyella sp. LH-20]WOP20203.1 amidase [Raineyella sp. LH-20]
MTNELLSLSLSEISGKVAAKEISPVELAHASLDRLEEVEPALTAFVTVTPELLLEQAKAAEAEIARGDYRGPLHGIPMAVKDLYDTAGIRTTSSSAQRADHVPATDSAAVAKLYDAGMTLIGKTHTHEFAYGATTPTTGNPWDPTRTPGGSSGGSGAAVGAGVVHVALGSDTGGSIRIPAALCGTVGLKPTYGRASRAGVASLSWSLDHVGPLTRNVTDAGIVLAAMSGYDRRDPASVDLPVPDLVTGIDAGIAGKKVGIPTNFYTHHIQPEVVTAWKDTAAKLESLGAQLVEIEIPFAEYLLSVEWAILCPEATAYHRDYTRNTPQLFTDEVRTLNEMGEAVLATDYLQALRLRTRIQQGFKELYEGLDVILAPGVAATAAKRDDPYITWEDGVVESATSVYSRMSAPANVTGLPSLVVPSAFSSEGLPIAVQIIGKPFAEREILQVGYALEQHSDVVGRIAPVIAAEAAV